MANNTSNNNKFYNYFSQSLSVAKKERLWCISHIINLIIKALIYSKGTSKLKCLIISTSDYIKFNLIQQRGFIGKLHNIIKYII